ncbi:MAG: cytochrome C biogenesis protein [Candidatus Taylorbacteria bacterium RIFCSPLOWO2_01_FULL_45_15b]|uniref:Cytochrome C biogenesis protein n=1 Tax=Candidatus Taylorbacteria bacterium RIFCSPLOWO2_01_FULL_45_15b TaxID=1802319 RepID=A0A1G2NFS4_9BACT|nr:MAG: cytochrome C biogenesis protein [Candidatus Taylorbacteria bacterium RIFCSPLOWO2_01_FULL_45_15b]
MTLLFISFVAGILTVLAPCILPLLPVIIGGSLANPRERLRPYIITASLAVSVVLFTLILKWSTALIDIPPNFWKWFSGGIIIIFGLTLLFPKIWELLPFASKTYQQSNILLGKGYNKKSLSGDIVIGLALGPVFSSCSPTYFIILATVLPASFALGFLYLVAYAIGLSLVLLLISLVGQRLVDRLVPLSDPHGKIKKIIGALFLIVGIAILFGLDKKFQTYILEQGIFDITKVEQLLLRKME